MRSLPRRVQSKLMRGCVNRSGPIWVGNDARNDARFSSYSAISTGLGSKGCYFFCRRNCWALDCLNSAHISSLVPVSFCHSHVFVLNLACSHPPLLLKWVFYAYVRKSGIARSLS